MKVVVAGGSGMIGTAICQALAADGHEVVILTRKVGRPTPGVRAVAWDPPHDGDWTAEIADAGAVINLAGASIGRWPWTARRKQVLRESRLSADQSWRSSFTVLA
jgi:NAD dependent epimerase/dehydratase family enzyme